MYEGSAFNRSSTCGDLSSGTTKQVAEWNICWAPIARDISAGRCVVYSFGIANDDPFTNFMASSGCTVFAFDPARQYPRNYKTNVTFFQYGLVSVMANETEYTHRHWGETSSASFGNSG